jgi:type II restriction enzyme
MENQGNDLAALQAALAGLTPSQVGWVRGVILQFKLPHEFQRDPASDFVSDAVLERIGDALRIHHAFSRQALSKDRFEFALERALNLSGIKAALVRSRTNRGHDITIADVPVSLKTEAAVNIKADTIHVSKWMELGKGEWLLPRLRDLFLEHMQSYDRIFTLRCLAPGSVNYRYELVEIPKALMLEAGECKFEIMETSRQNPKPGYGYVRNTAGALKYALYFDGGTERKLQIRSLRKALCHVHAIWAFESAPLE